MLKKSLILLLSSLTLLVTSFCVHMNEEQRNISSTTYTDLSKKVKPQIIENAKGDKIFIFFQVHRDEPLTTIQVQYLCAADKAGVKKDWDIFNVAHFSGVSDLIDGSSIRIRYYPIAILNFNIDDIDEEQERAPLDKVFDLKDACPVLK